MSEEFDFRNALWGMNKSDIMASEEGSPVVQTDSQVGYFTRILEWNIYVGYVFKEDLLVSTLYALRDTRDNLKDSFKDFKDFKRILTMKYGEPNAGQGDVWADGAIGKEASLKTLIANSMNYEAALRDGRILHAALWKTDRTWIKAALSKMMEGQTCGVTIEYISKEHM